MSLAETEKGLRDVIKNDQLFEAKPAIMRAFQYARLYTKGTGTHGDDYLEKRDFRIFLVALRQRFEYLVAFRKIDTGNDQRFDFKEFSAALPQIEKWVGPIQDPKEEFKKIDGNGKGQILFDEFCEWSIKKKLDLEDDDEEEVQNQDPYEGDADKYQEHFRKTFITENQKGDGEIKEVWTLHDMMIPAGMTSKLVRIRDPGHEDFRISEVGDKLKLINPSPVIILAGAMTQRAGKTLAGVARAAFRADATIIDSGVGSGIEKFCIRKRVPFFGVAPDECIQYPRLSQEAPKDNELTNGHTHFVLIGDNEAQEAYKKDRQGEKPKSFDWGDETTVKFELAKRIAAGRNKMGGAPPCKIVTVLLGDNNKCAKEIETSINMGYPVVVVEGSSLSNAITAAKNQQDEKNQVDSELTKNMSFWQ